MIENDKEFKKNIIELIDIEVVQNFDKREENANKFYDDTSED